MDWLHLFPKQPLTTTRRWPWQAFTHCLCAPLKAFNLVSFFLLQVFWATTTVITRHRKQLLVVGGDIWQVITGWYRHVRLINGGQANLWCYNCYRCSQWLMAEHVRKNVQATTPNISWEKFTLSEAKVYSIFGCVTGTWLKLWKSFICQRWLDGLIDRLGDVHEIYGNYLRRLTMTVNNWYLIYDNWITCLARGVFLTNLRNSKCVGEVHFNK